MDCNDPLKHNSVGGCGRSSPNTERRFSRPGLQKAAGLFVWLYRGILDTRDGCIATHLPRMWFFGDSFLR
jgi:hypothetical protein